MSDQLEISKRLRAMASGLITLAEELETELNPALSRPIDDLELSVRSYHVIRDLGAKTVADLIEFTPAALLRQRNCGRKSLKEIELVLAEIGLQLKDSGQ